MKQLLISLVVASCHAVLRRRLVFFFFFFFFFYLDSFAVKQHIMSMRIKRWNILEYAPQVWPFSCLYSRYGIIDAN